jgi:hypothetical protein
LLAALLLRVAQGTVADHGLADLVRVRRAAGLERPVASLRPPPAGESMQGKGAEGPGRARFPGGTANALIAVSVMTMSQADSTGPFSVVAHEEVGAQPDALARHAIGVVLRRLSALPSSPEVMELLRKAQDYLQQAQDWHSLRTAGEWDALMKRVLGSYVAVAKLERGASNARALG